MSTSALATTEGTLRLFGTGLLLALAGSAGLFFGFGMDLLAYPGLGIPCPFHSLTGFACPGCGMTRALWLASQLEWTQALRMNPLIYPLIAFAIVSTLRPRSPRAMRATGPDSMLGGLARPE